MTTLRLETFEYFSCEPCQYVEQIPKYIVSESQENFGEEGEVMFYCPKCSRKLTRDK